MQLLLGVILVSWLITISAYIPFIKFLYRNKFQRMKQKTLDAFNQRTPIFDKFHKNKVGTPVGGGTLIILITTILFPIILLCMRYFWIPITSVYPFWTEVKIIIFTFLSFGLLGLLDDAKKTFVWATGDFFGLRLRHKLIIELVLAGIISYWLFAELKINIFYVPLIGVIHLGWLYIPLAMFMIIAYSNAFNITDGLDGLSAGVLFIALTAFWIISAAILDTPLSIFLALWMGGLLAFLYFNVFPARIFLGDVGALSFGATLAVVALLLGKAPILTIIGGVFVAEVTSSLIQLTAKKFWGRKIIAAAPLHLLLQHYGWPETKIVLRFWIISIVLALFGLWLAIFTPRPLL
jgi:phospho-N-acetylmuramoyl-pentapeptide-transferase